MIKCVIVDDEINAVKNLALDLSELSPEVDLIGQFSCPLLATEFLKNNAVDLLFLDVEMPHLNGIQFLSQFPQPKFHTVFTTAYSEYAIEAIKKNAFDYLMKPIEMEELTLCISRFQQKIRETNLQQRDPSQAGDDWGKTSTKIKIFTEGKILFLDASEILYCKAEGSYTIIYCSARNQITVSKNMKTVSSWLSSSVFLRVHHSYIVNRQKIKEFHRQENYLILEDNSSVPVSRQKKNEILNLL